MISKNQLSNAKNIMDKLNGGRMFNNASYYSGIPNRISLFIALSINVSSMLKTIHTPFVTDPIIMRMDHPNLPASTEFLENTFDDIFGDGFYSEIIDNNHSFSRINLITALAKWLAKNDQITKLQKEHEYLVNEVVAIDRIIAAVEAYEDIKKNIPNQTFQRIKSLKVSKKLRMCEIQSLL